MDYNDFVKGFAVAIGIILILEFATGRNTKIQKTTYKQDESVYICGKSFYLEDYDNNVNTFINGIKEECKLNDYYLLYDDGPQNICRNRLYLTDMQNNGELKFSTIFTYVEDACSD